MLPILVTVTDTDQVRSVIGVDDKDLSDAEFDSVRVELELTISFEEASIDYATVISDGEGAPTADQKKRYDYLKLYSLYFCAVTIFPRIRLAASQKVGDGDNTMERFLNPKFDNLEKAANAKVSTYLASLQAAISGSTVVDSVVSQFSGVSPTYDPVTGS